MTEYIHLNERQARALLGQLELVQKELCSPQTMAQTKDSILLSDVIRHKLRKLKNGKR